MRDQLSKARVGVLALVVAVVLVGVASPVLAGGGASSSPASEGLTLEELRDNGETISQEYPSVRKLGGEGYWLVRYPPSGMNTYGGKNADREFLSPSSTIQRTKVRLFSSEFGSDGAEMTLKVAYWKKTTEKVTEGNTTTTEQTADVLAVDEQTVTFEGAVQPHADVKVRKMFDGARVTIWSTEHPEELRWTARVNTLATAQPVNIDSKNELYSWSIWWLVLPTALLLLVGYGVASHLRQQAGASPQRRGQLLGGGLLILGGLYLFAYVELASLIAAIPLVFPVTLAFIVFVLVLHDDEDPVREVGALALEAVDAMDPVDPDDSITDARHGDIQSVKLVSMPNGEEAVYHSGFRAWYARLKGHYTTWNPEGKASNIETTGDYDELYLVSEEMENALEHTPETTLIAWPWKTFDLTKIDGEPTEKQLQKAAVFPEALAGPQYISTVLTLGFIGTVAFASHQFLGAWIWGALAVLPAAIVHAEPVSGTAYTRVAPGQRRKAFATAFYEDYKMKQLSNIPELLGEVFRLRGERDSIAEEIADVKDRSIIEQANSPDSFGESSLIEDSNKDVMDAVQKAVDELDESKNGAGEGAD